MSGITQLLCLEVATGSSSFTSNIFCYELIMLCYNCLILKLRNDQRHSRIENGVLVLTPTRKSSLKFVNLSKKNNNNFLIFSVMADEHGESFLTSATIGKLLLF